MQINFWIPVVVVAVITGLAAIFFHPKETVRRSGYYRKFSQSPSVTWYEALAVFCAAFFIQWLGWNIAIRQQASAVEFLNGHIAAKGSTDWQFDVCDSYSTDKDGNRTCTSHHTEYRTNYWANTNYVEFFPSEGHLNYGDVKRNDPPPQRWALAQVGDPVTTLHTYTNNVKGAGRLNQMFPNSPLTQTLRDQNAFPPLPTSLHSFDYAPKVFYIGGTPQNGETYSDVTVKFRDGKINSVHVYTLNESSREMNKINDPLGNSKQANTQVFFVVGQPIEYANAYMDYAEGGGKNDVNVFVGLSDDGQTVVWATVRFGLVGFDQTDESNGGSNAMLDIKLGRELRHKTLTELGGYTGVVKLSGEYVNLYFDRVPNKQFKFLEAEFEPRGGWAVFVNFTTYIVALVLLVVAFIVNVEEI